VKDCQEHLRNLQNQPIPVVYIDRYCEGIEADVFCADNFDGGYKLTSLLLSRAYHKIAAFRLDDYLTNNIDRIEGYKAALKESGKQARDNSVFNIGYQEFGSQSKPALDKVIEDAYDAIFFANNSIAIRSIEYFNEMKISIPDDMAIVSFDNPEAFHISKPGISCYKQPMEAICTGTLELIAQKLENVGDVSPKINAFKGDMIVRDSC
jgi:LacI family transcriptional regulator